MGRKKKVVDTNVPEKIVKEKKSSKKRVEKKNGPIYHGSLIDRRPIDHKILDFLSETYARAAWDQILLMAA